MTRQYVWPVIIICSGIAVKFSATITDGSWLWLRALTTFGFFLLCPGMAFLPFLRIKDGSTELILAVALSICIGTGLAEWMVLAKTWQPELALSALVGLSVTGALLQIVAAFRLGRQGNELKRANDQ